MARGVNKVILLGRLGADPDIKHTQNGKPVATLSIATSRAVKKDDKWEDVTEWHRVVCWDKLAETCEKYLNKGDQVVTWWQGRYQARCSRVVPPSGKDPGEAFALGVDVRAWLLSALSPAVQLFAERSSRVMAIHESPLPRELKVLIASTPVRIVRYADADGRGVRVDAPGEWEKTHPAEASRISELVFGSEVVMEWLSKNEL